MDLSCGILFGKRSETVRRAGDTPELNKNIMGAQPEATPVASQAQQSYSADIVGYAKRQGLSVEEEPVQDVFYGMKRRREDSFDFENIYSPQSCDHLPHPSKLRKSQERKTVKNSHAEKHMCIDYHLSQLRQRNQKYQLCKEQQASFPLENTEETKFQEPDKELTPETPCWMSVSEHLPQLTLPSFHKKLGPLFQPLYTTGKVLLGSASVEQLQEEERWFRKVWKTKITSKPSEE
ncbi:uncharacterized protein [Haliotis asinina]|uniref:uncharacterized protein n=1 Tax=Haliotis asinina TaxID=109174 RepID=UPI0035325551